MIHLFGFSITIFQILATVFGVGLLVFIHELGHFLMAKKFKIRVEQFSFGFGPEIIGYTYGETRYSICAIPLGGMVKLPGEDIDTATGSPGEFMSQAWYKRLIIAFFGPFMNYVLAVFLFTIVFYFWGLSIPSNKPIIGDVMEGYPAKLSGLLPGDAVENIDGVPIKDWQQMAEVIHKNPSKKIKVNILREKKSMQILVVPLKDPASGIGLVGIAPSIETKKVNLINSFGYGIKMVVFQTIYTLKYLGDKIIRWEKPEVAGPIGVVQLLAKAAKAGIENLLNFLAVISVALGLFNLFPIPLVDGGHIVLALVEAVTRKPLNKKVVQVSNFVGLSLIVFIFIFATYSDLARLGLKFGK
jgi:regulator of sigma E protease